MPQTRRACLDRRQDLRGRRGEREIFSRSVDLRVGAPDIPSTGTLVIGFWSDGGFERLMFPAIDLGALERYRVPATGRRPKLVKIDPRDQDGLPYRKPEAKKATAADTAEISRLQEILYAQAKHAILVVLQGMDTSGKD